MREVADRDRIGALIAALAREAASETHLFLVGGACAVLVGWRPATGPHRGAAPPCCRVNSINLCAATSLWRAADAKV